MMRNKIVLLWTFFLFICCKNKEVKSFDEDKKNNEQNIEYLAKVDFPDTIFSNKKYKGNIVYTSSFDNIVKKLNNYKSDTTRIVMLVYYLPEKQDGTNINIESIAYDTTFTYELPNVPIRDIEIKEKGKYRLSWLIKDMIIIDTIKDKENIHTIPMKVEETRVVKDVVVME